MRLTTTAVAIVLLGLLARPQSVPSRKDATVLLHAAIERANLSSADTPPFHLIAAVHYELDGQASDGTYQVFWTAPDRFREELRVGAISDIRVASESALYVTRNTPVPTLVDWSVQQLVGSPLGLKEKWGIDRVFTERRIDPHPTCFEILRGDLTWHVCFAPQTSDPASVHVESRYLGVVLQTELSKYVPLGKRRFPWLLVRHVPTEDLTIRVNTLEEITSPREELFTPPAGAEKWEWCPDAKKAGNFAATEGEIGPQVPVDAIPRGITAWYFLIGPDGYVKKSAAIHSDPGFARRYSYRFADARYPVALCGKKPIEYEFVFEVARAR
jgi:hypothetical protein